MYFDKRIFYIILGIMILTSIVGRLTEEGFLLNLVLMLPGVLVAITFHEFAHAYAADKLGDDTPRLQGRLNLNPLSHLDPIGSVMLIFAGFGWGKPVEINPRNFNRKYSMTKAEAIVSIAGPLMNFVLAIVFCIVYFLIIKFAGSFALTQAGIIIVVIIQCAIAVNIGLGVFNLIPLPPLDGSKVLKIFLPYNAKTWFERYEQIFYIVFVVLWITGIAGDIVSPIIELVRARND